MHDYMYRNKFNRKYADECFLRLMKKDGANFAQRWAMYLAVRMFGGLFYNK